MPTETLRRLVDYQPDAAVFFDRVGGRSTTDSVLLESVDIHTRTGVQSLAILEGSLRLTCRGNRVTLDPLTVSGRHLADELRAELAEFVDGDDLVFPASHAEDERERLTAVSTIAPLRILQRDPERFVAGGFAFDYVETFEELPHVEDSLNTYPDYQFLVAEILLDIDHVNETATLSGIVSQGEPLRDRLDAIEAAMATHSDAFEPAGGTLTVTADISDERFREIVTDCQERIYDGSIYQVLPARSFTAPCRDAFAAYLKLRETNPSPYMFYIRGLADAPYEIFGASPESNLKFDAASRQVELYPIAGTRPRGATEELDIRMELEMRTDSKELAEHTMLVDLARNDLARIAVPGTRRVAELLQVDRYSQVMHLVSRVVATLDDDFDALDAYRACMNMGTLTGAPKLRAMEILREVEGKRRGTYGGAVGYLRGGGDFDTCIVIRSAFVQAGTAVVQAGAGVVRDSDPQAEADESANKARAVLNALALAEDAQLEVIR